MYHHVVVPHKYSNYLLICKWLNVGYLTNPTPSSKSTRFVESVMFTPVECVVLQGEQAAERRGEEQQSG